MMFLFIVLLHFLRGISGTNIEPAETICTANACFTFILEPRMFEEAQYYCQENGGNLAVITDRNEAAEIQSALSRIGKNGSQFWIGLKLQKGNCAVPVSEFRGFKWINGMEDTKYANWDREPKFTCTEDRCVAVYYTLNPFGTADLRWRDRSCKDDVAFVCKFNFKGMCKSLRLSGPGKVTYVTPFNIRPLSNGNALTMLPHATYATIACDGQERQSLCIEMNGFFGWTNPGPFCDSHKRSCKYSNGGCEHLCSESFDGDVRCGCKEGYGLGVDEVSCVPRDFCENSPCEFTCVSGPHSYTCTCPPGFQLAADEISCIDIDECANMSGSRVCEHTCVNVNGSYRCSCENGYKMVDGKCKDIDECIEHRCPQHCLNLEGSFSCYCGAGFTGSGDGLSCVDINECLSGPCQEICINIIGSYKCSCIGNSKLAADGITCNPIQELDTNSTKMSTEAENSGGNKGVGLNGTEDDQFMPDEVTTIRYEVRSSYTVNSSVFSPTAGVPPSNRSVVGKSFTDKWMFVSIVSSVAVLITLIAVTSVVVVCRNNREKDKKKKNLTPDNYCWVSSE